MVRSTGPTCRRPGPGGTRAGAAVVAIGVGCPVARLGAHGRRGGKCGPQSAQSAYSAPGPPSLERESVEVRRDAPVGAPPEGSAKEVTRRRRRVTTAASRDDSVVAHGSLPAAWSDSGVTGVRTYYPLLPSRPTTTVSPPADLALGWGAFATRGRGRTCHASHGTFT